MPVSPPLVPTGSVDLTLPGGRLRAAVRAAVRPDSTVELRDDGVYVRERSFVALRRETKQPVDFTSGAAVFEADAGDASADAAWSPLVPSWFTLREGVWWATIRLNGVLPVSSSPDYINAFQNVVDVAQGLVLESESRYVAIDGVVSTTGASGVGSYQFSRYAAKAAGPWPVWLAADNMADWQGQNVMAAMFVGAFLVPRTERYRLVGRFQLATPGVEGWFAGPESPFNYSLGQDPTAIYPSGIVASWVAPYR